MASGPDVWPIASTGWRLKQRSKNRVILLGQLASLVRLLHFERAPLRPSHHQSARAFLSIGEQLDADLVGILSGTRQLLSMVLSVPRELEREFRRRTSNQGGRRHLNALAMREKPQGGLRGRMDQRGHLEYRGAVEFLRQLHGHGKLKWAV